MDYQILINQKEFLSGDLIVVAFITLIFFIVLLYISILLWSKLESNEKLKYEFITIIAHKFRTPLTQIKWTLESLLPDEHDSFKKEALSNIGVSAKTLINLTNTLVEITDSKNRSSSYNFEKINICDSVKKVANLLTERFHEKNIFFGIDCSDPEIFVKIDRSRMEFVLQTLIENSINYSPSGRNVQIYIVKVKRTVSISIQDHGIGIDPNDMPKIFTKFFRTKNAQSMDTDGFGVGLFLAKSIVKKHKHGNLEVFSDGIGKGTTFVVTLPVVR